MNSDTGAVSIVRKRAHIGVNARSPFPQNSRKCPTNRIGNVRTGREIFKPSRGCGDEGRPCPYTISGSQPGTASGARHPHPVDNASTEGSPYKCWNENALSRWLGPENLGWAILDGVRTRVLVDNGARVNSVTPAYVHQHKLGVRSISELDHTLTPSGTVFHW